MDQTQVRACREQALRYLQLSRSLEKPELKRMFMELSESWTFLADEIERALMKEHNETLGA
jgi:hypothetical protein